MQFLNDDLIYYGKKKRTKPSCPNLSGPTRKMYCPLLLNHERTVINHIVLES